MAQVVGGPRNWKVSRDDQGHRTFEVVHRVKCGPGEGPAAALSAQGLPAPGDRWLFNPDPTTGVPREADVWAWCTLSADAEPVIGEGEPEDYWDVTHTFSSQPSAQTEQPGDPLLQPQRVSGSFIKVTEEATTDRFGRPVVNSAWERFRGQQVEFDGGSMSVHVEQNVALLDLPALAASFNTVNGLPMWGMPPRTIKLSGVSWDDPKPYTRPDPLTGAPVQAQYYTRKFDFEVNFGGWDRDLLDEGNKVLHGHWKYLTTTTTTTQVATTSQGQTTTTGPAPIESVEPVQWELLPVDGAGTMPNRFNPTHFDRFVDRWGNPGKVILNGAGMPAGSVAPLGKWYISLQANNLQHGLTDTDWWAPLRDDPTGTAPSYDEGTRYPRGSLVSYGGSRYVALKDTPMGELVGGPSNADYWKAVPAVTDAGLYGATVQYSLGDYVEANLEIRAGYFHMEKYHESDFVGWLGVPAVL